MERGMWNVECGRNDEIKLRGAIKAIMMVFVPERYSSIIVINLFATFLDCLPDHLGIANWDSASKTKQLSARDSLEFGMYKRSSKFQHAPMQFVKKCSCQLSESIQNMHAYNISQQIFYARFWANKSSKKNLAMRSSQESARQPENWKIWRFCSFPLGF